MGKRYAQLTDAGNVATNKVSALSIQCHFDRPRAHIIFTKYSIKSHCGCSLRSYLLILSAKP